MAHFGKFHTFALPIDPNFYRYTACVNRGDTVRFYDSEDAKGVHYQSVCADDCIFRNKNAILPASEIITTNTYSDTQGVCSSCDCNSATPNNNDGVEYVPVDRTEFTKLYKTCNNAMNYPNFTIQEKEVAGIRVDLFCKIAQTPTEPPRMMYEQFSNYARNRLKSILIATENMPNNLTDINSLYLPDGVAPYIFGPLIDTKDPQIFSSYNSFSEGFGSLEVANNLVRDMLFNCINYDETRQGNNINFCRTTYMNVYGNFVGPSNPLTLVPTSRDQAKSMGIGCLYALEIYNNDSNSDHTTSNNCPRLTALCTSGGLKGKWEYGLANPQKFSLDKLNGSLCRNYGSDDTTYNPFFQAVNQNNDPQTSTQIISAFDPISITQPKNSFNGGIYPSAFSGYIYRSCDLLEFGIDGAELKTALNCCSNDFADMNGSPEFIPPVGLPPIKISRESPSINGVSTTLLGYDYSSSSESSYYNRCFTENGYACDPIHRDITNTECSRFMISHCFLENPPPSTLSWTLDTQGSGECSKWIGRLLYGDRSKWLSFIDVVTTRGFLPPYTGTKLTGEYLFDIILPNIPKLLSLQNIVDGGGSIADPLMAAVEPIFFTLYKSYNLAIYDNGWLLGQCSPYKSDDIIKYSLLRQWCGCFMNTDIYQTLYPNISSECTPFCNSSDVIQLGQQCQGSACIIDDVTVSIINSQVGYVSINQFCNACATSTSSDTQNVSEKCNCTISNVNITALSSKIGNISIDQLCNLGGAGNSSSTAQQAVDQVSANPISLILGDLPSSIFMIAVILLIMTLVFYDRPRIRNGLLVTLLLTILAGAVFYYYSYSSK